MDDRQRIRFLEERLAQVTREKMEAITALEMALDLHRYLPTLDEGTSAESLLEEASPRIRAVLPFRAFAFYLVGEGFPSFDRIYCDPVSWSAFVEREKTLLVEDGSFSWAIDRRKVVAVTSSAGKRRSSSTCWPRRAGCWACSWGCWTRRRRSPTCPSSSSRWC